MLATEIGRNSMKRIAGCAVLLLFCSCELFGWIDPDDLPYRQEILWRQPTATSEGAPAADAAAVYVLGLNRTLYAVDRRQGTVRWSVPTQQIGIVSGVVRVGNVVVSAAGSLVAFDTATKAVAWQNALSDRLGELPVASTDSVIYPSSFSSSTGTAYALSASQQVRWQTVIIPPDSALGASDFVRAFTPDIRDATLAYSFSWWRGGAQTVPKGGIAVVDASSGNLRWSRMLPILSSNSNTTPSDAVTDGTGVFVAVKDGRVFAFSVIDGALKWTAPPITSQAGATDIRPLTVIDGSVVVGSGRNQLVAYDAQTGQQRWRVDTENGGTAQVHRFRSADVLTLHYNGGLTLREAKTGRLLWLVEPRQNAQRVNDLHIAGDTVFGVSADVGMTAFRLISR